MKRKSMFSALVMMGLSTTLVASCSSNIKKADIPATANPREEITKLETDLQAAVTDNIDVLAANEFESSAEYLAEAKSAVAAGGNQEKALEPLRMGRGYLTEAYKTAKGRSEKAEGLFAARQAALKAGASAHSELEDDMQNLDDDVASLADSLGQTSAEDLVEFQRQYVELEKRAVILTHLGDTQAKINGARENGAQDSMPVTLKKAELSLKTAESMISTNVRNPKGYQAAVKGANKDVNHLLAVMKAHKNSGGTLTEASAVKMVSQATQISQLTSNMDRANAESTASDKALSARNEELTSDMASQDQKMMAAKRTNDIQAAMEQARTQFTPEEAEAYQQGENLVIRLKQVNFASGRSEIPSLSLPLLAKISEVAKSLNASQLMIEGHTDSVGGESINKSISDQRASAVATYFKTNGFDAIEVQSKGWGFAKPIASNTSKEGRAQNRRVDIIITPEVESQ